jgi:hypothetical protein
MRRILGSSDFDRPTIVSLITDAALCGDCISRKTRIPRGRLDDALRWIADTVAITSRAGRCDACRKDAVVHRIVLHEDTSQ